MTETALHDWRIEDREYARQESRRGRRHAYEQLDPARTCLVVIDMVSFFVEENPYCRGIVPRIAELADAVRRAGGHVAWVVPGSPAADHPATGWAEGFHGAAVAELYLNAGGRGPLRGRVCSEFDVGETDVVLEKTAPSAFFPGRCTLDADLRQRGVDTVLVTGTVTNVCCEATARDAATLGYRVVMVADANAARRDRDHNATLHTVYRAFGDVRPTIEVLGLLGSRR